MLDRGTAFAISAPSIFDGAQFLSHHCVIVQHGTVVQLLPTSQCPTTLEILALPEGVLAPGLIDLQVNGGGDVMFNNSPCEETLTIMLDAHRATGTTSLMPTLISDTGAMQRQAVAAVRAAIAGGAQGILGIHLEGPYFEDAKRGVHSADLIRAATNEDIDWLCSLEDICVIVTLAPEHLAAGHIRRLCDGGLHVCAGHSNATYTQIRAAVAEGLEGVTHLFNAMSPLTSREPGVVGAALEDASLWAGIIADGHHVHPASIRLAQQTKPPGKLVLISDAMATVGGSVGQFSLYGEVIQEREGKLHNAAGALAGSAIGMIDAVRYTSMEVGIALDECLRMASLYPAIILGLDDRLGRIDNGYRADLVHFDDNFAVHNTWLAGQHRRHL
jgi:N-acetylglucosamine-6-phosphate deacetylase